MYRISFVRIGLVVLYKAAQYSDKSLEFDQQFHSSHYLSKGP
jgi:hypothetical protein